jgi:hypothetical protein
MDDLGEGVHSGIGATGADDEGLLDLKRGGQGGAKNADHRCELGLVGEARKRVAVVRDVQTPALDV